MLSKIHSRLKQLTDRLWAEDLRSTPFFRRTMIGSLRICVHAIGSFRRNLVGIQAAGLTMFTLLALFPLLWLGFFVAKVLGFSKYLMGRFGHFTAGVPDNLKEVVDQLRGTLERVNQENLELWGSLILVYTGYALFTKVEQAINGVWKAHHRSWYKRFGSFVGLIFIVPLLALGAIVGESIVSQMPLIGGGVRVLPVIGLWLALTALYKLMPSASVRWIPASIAGGLAAVAGTALHNLYIYAQFGVAQYNALYAALAVIPMLLVYLELWWTVILAGAEACYAIQNLHSLGPKRVTPPLSHRLRRRLALALMQAMTEGADQSPPLALSLADFTGEVDVPRPWVDHVVYDLEQGALVEKAAEDTVQYVDPRQTVSAWDVVRAVEGEDPGDRMELSEDLEACLADARAALRSHLGEVRFRSSASS